MNASQDKAMYIRFMRGESLWDIAYEMMVARHYAFDQQHYALARVEAAIRRHLIRKEGHAR